MISMLLSAHLLKGLLSHLSCLARYSIRLLLITVHHQSLRFRMILDLWLLQFQSKNALLSTFLFLDQIVWLGRTGIIKVCRDLKA